jgi:hypothetical protein
MLVYKPLLTAAYILSFLPFEAPNMHLFIVPSLAALALTLLPPSLGADNPLPAKGDNGDMGGIFGIGKSIVSAGVSDMPPGLMNGLFTPGLETPKGTAVGATTVGSGPYPARYVADPTLPNHTVYAPKSPPPANIKMPVIIFGNGGCVNIGTLMSSLLTEIASHGYLVIANGPPQKGVSMSMTAGALPQLAGKGLQGLLSGLGSMMSMAQSKVSQMTESIDWVYKGNAKKYGEIDIGKIAASGQSCGALEA